MLKNAFYIALYLLLYRPVKASRKRSRAAILLYHRVNDFSQDVLTVSTEMFAAHLLAIRKHYPVISSEKLTRCIEKKEIIKPTSIAIHFDDAYRDVYTCGGAILAAAGLPATAFVSSGFVDTDRSFEHDLEKYPFHYENLRRADLQNWVRKGFEVGAHTVNHVNLGTCSLEETRFEIVESGAQLESHDRAAGKIVFFSLWQDEGYSARGHRVHPRGRLLSPVFRLRWLRATRHRSLGSSTNRSGRRTFAPVLVA